MKKMIASASFLVTGALLFLSVFVAASNLPADGWEPSGRLWQSVSDNNITLVLLVSIAFLVAGIALFVWEMVCSSKKK